jgi:predicted ATPase
MSEVGCGSLASKQYEATFRENEVSEKVLPNLTAEDLKDLGVGMVGHRRMLLPLQVRIGAATGMVVVGDLVGSGEAQEHDIVGETPNLAARNNPASLMHAMSVNCLTQLISSNYATAQAQSDEMIGLAEDKGSNYWKASGMLRRAGVLALTGKASNAVGIFSSAIPTVRSMGTRIYFPVWLSLLARGYGELGQFDDAWSHIGEAMTAVETTKLKWCEADVHRIAGEIALMSPEPDAAKAEARFDHALAVARAQQAKSWELRAAMSMARLWREQGKWDEARDLLAPVYGWFTEGFDTLDLKQAKALLDELT